MIPFLDLKAINLRHAESFQQALNAVLKSGRFTLGSVLEGFENEFASYCDAQHCIGVSDGLNALRLVLQAWGVGPGDEVIVPSNTFIATWLAVSQVGARPIPVEPRADTLNIDPDLIAGAITSKTRAIIPVHLYGQPADMAPIMALADKHGLKVLEDAAQSHGATYHGARTGSLGHAAAFSFYPSKNLGALGDGGAITTGDSNLASKLRELRNYGSPQKYVHTEIGLNARLDELQAAFLSVKLKCLDQDNAQRRLIAQIYLDGLKDSGLALPHVIEGAISSWHLFALQCDARDDLQASLIDSRIETLVHYPIPPHLQKAYLNLAWCAGDYPISEQSARQVLSLPIGPTMTSQEAKHVVRVVGEKMMAIKKIRHVF